MHKDSHLFVCGFTVVRRAEEDDDTIRILNDIISSVSRYLKS